MTEKTVAPLRETLSCYKNLPRMVRFHNYVRHATCPFERIEPWVPRGGTIYDLGCGHGLFSLYMAISSPRRRITGFDISEEKIRIAREAARDIPNVSFHHADILTQDLDPCDVITILDVLYLMPPGRVKEIVSKCHRMLRPGGMLILSTTDTHPRWKYLLAYCQELLAVKILRITEGRELFFHSRKELGALLQTAGFTVHAERMDRGYVHPHILFACSTRQDATGK
ncbi:MAG: class I SAM-dependent methyltransferase [Candidatus Aureabacteria bacterium]|nr:class I SAM-dependent methyltransferase [Candidatus Auribacterota bacterium]